MEVVAIHVTFTGGTWAGILTLHVGVPFAVNTLINAWDQAGTAVM